MLHRQLRHRVANAALFSAGLLLFLVNQAPNAIGQVQKTAEKVLARQIVCEQFQRDPDDGSWLGGPHAVIGTSDFSNTKFEKKGMKINGIIISDLLDRKCRETAVSSFVADACDARAWGALPVLHVAHDVSHAKVEATPSALGIEVVAGFGE